MTVMTVLTATAMKMMIAMMTFSSYDFNLIIIRPKTAQNIKIELGPTAGPTDGRTDKPAYRDAETHLKKRWICG